MEGKEAVAGCKEREEGLKELIATAKRFLINITSIAYLDCYPILAFDAVYAESEGIGAGKCAVYGQQRAKPKQVGKQ